MPSIIFVFIIIIIFTVVYYFFGHKSLFKKVIFAILCFIVLSNFSLQVFPSFNNDFITKNNINTTFQILQISIILTLFLFILFYNLFYFKQTSLLTKIIGFLYILWIYLIFSGNIFLLVGIPGGIYSFFISMLGNLIPIGTFWQTFLGKNKKL